MPRARQCDVRQPEVLSALLSDVLLPMVLELDALERDVEHTPVVRFGVVEGHGLVVGDMAGLPQEREVDDREFEALAAMYGQDLDGFGVGFQAAAAILVGGVAFGLDD